MSTSWYLSGLIAFIFVSFPSICSNSIAAEWSTILKRKFVRVLNQNSQQFIDKCAVLLLCAQLIETHGIAGGRADYQDRRHITSITAWSRRLQINPRSCSLNNCSLIFWSYVTTILIFPAVDTHMYLCSQTSLLSGIKLWEFLAY